MPVDVNFVRALQALVGKVILMKVRKLKNPDEPNAGYLIYDICGLVQKLDTVENDPRNRLFVKAKDAIYAVDLEMIEEIDDEVPVDHPKHIEFAAISKRGA